MNFFAIFYKINVRHLLWQALQVIVMFGVIYTAVNWYRKPALPAVSALSFYDIDGNHYALDRLSQDQAVLVYFWGTWCHICSFTSPKVNTLSQSYPVLTVAVASGDNAVLQRYKSTHDYQFIVINDDDTAIFKNWQGQVTPSFAIIKDGKMVQGFTGITPLWTMKARLWIANW
ncbi:MAG: protein disulfide oxidoreductase [Moraxella sp.]|nr:protein disulfide oxidoreductase [Moraxella sp.]